MTGVTPRPQVREIHAEDPHRAELAEALVKLEEACFTVPWSLPSLKQTLALPSVVCLVSEQLTRPAQTVGYALLFEPLGDAELLRMGVAPQFRGQGLGKELLAHYVKRARELRVERIWLEVRDHNQAARALYQALGFEDVGRRRGYYEDGTDAVTMVLALA